ncbi:MAG: rubredoxin [Deltaproteobacteria bacterium]|nr:rubredoxin [Deltaproteobacteria bacterium]
MATYTCEKCGKVMEARCKPRKCHHCGESGSICKQETPGPKKKRGKK